MVNIGAERREYDNRTTVLGNLFTKKLREEGWSNIRTEEIQTFRARFDLMATSPEGIVHVFNVKYTTSDIQSLFNLGYNYIVQKIITDKTELLDTVDKWVIVILHDDKSKKFKSRNARLWDNSPSITKEVGIWFFSTSGIDVYKEAQNFSLSKEELENMFLSINISTKVKSRIDKKEGNLTITDIVQVIAPLVSQIEVLEQKFSESVKKEFQLSEENLKLSNENLKFNKSFETRLKNQEEILKEHFKKQEKGNFVFALISGACVEPIILYLLLFGWERLKINNPDILFPEWAGHLGIAGIGVIFWIAVFIIIKLINYIKKCRIREKALINDT